MYERGSRVSQGSDGVVSVPRVLGFVRSRTPVEVEEDVGLGGDLHTRRQAGTVGREGGNRFGEGCQGRVDLRREVDESYAGEAALVAYKSRQPGETGFPLQTCCVGVEKAIRYPPTDPSPQDRHRVQDGRGGAPYYRPIQENQGQVRAS